MSSSRLRTLPSRPRRTFRSVVASVAALLLATGGLVLASALPAQAHDVNIVPSCQSITLNFSMFDPDNPNNVTVTVDGKVVDGWDHKEFGRDFGATAPVISLGDPTVPHKWTVDVVAWDDPDGAKGFTKLYSGESTPCTTPTVKVDATTCTTVGGSTALSAIISGIATADAYRVELIAGGSVLSTQDFQPGQVPNPVPLGTHPAGATYTVKVTDLTIPSISTSASVTAASCPQIGGSEFTIEQCTAPGGSATLTLIPSGLAVGHTYTVHTGSATGTQVGSFVYADGGRYPVSITPPTTGQSDIGVFVVDQQGSVTSATITTTAYACPTIPRLGAAQVEACTLNATSSDVTIDVSNLTVGRTYQLTLDGQTVTGSDFTSDSQGTAQRVFRDVTPGQHTFGVIDKVSTAVFATEGATVEACPATPQLSVTPTQCSVPGAITSGSLVITPSGLVAGRSYTAKTVSGSTTVDTRTVDSTTAAYTLTGLATNASYTITVVDDQDADAAATPVTVLMAACPTQPKVGALTFECTVSGSVGTLSLGASDLITGHSYSVLFERATPAGGWVAVQQSQPTLSLTPAQLSLSGVSSGQTYRVTLADNTNTALSETSVIPIPDGCVTGRVDSVSYTAGRVSALALTGTDTGRLVIIALLLLVPGAGLIGFAILRHRREVRD